MERRKVLLAAAGMAVTPLGAFAQQRGQRGQRRGGRQRMGGEGMQTRLSVVEEAGIGQSSGEPPQPGDPAPDFKLMPLKLYEFQAEGTGVNQQTAAGLFEPVQLSSFKGNKPVALIFGSYT